MKGKMLLILILFWAMLPTIIKFALTSYPYIVDVNISFAKVEGELLHLKGTIKIDPNKIPEKDRPWYNSPDFLDWWRNETNVNKVIKRELKSWNKFVHIEIVKIAELRRIDGKKYDTIKFDVYVKVTIKKELG